MAVRLLLAALGVPLFLVACGDSTTAPGGSAGASPHGVSSGLAGSGASGAPTAPGGGASASVAGGSAGLGVSGRHEGGAGQSTSDVFAGAGGATGLGTAGAAGGTAGLGAGGAAAGTPSSAGTGAGGSGGQQSGIPESWLPVTDVDYSIVPGPNFETVRLMFKAAQCSGSDCHYGGRNHFQMGKSADQLYSYMKSFTTLDCGKLIDTANPSQSALVKYLRGPCNGPGRMPLSKCVDDGDELCVPEYYIQVIEQWIANGAPR